MEVERCRVEERRWSEEKLAYGEVSCSWRGKAVYIMGMCGAEVVLELVDVERETRSD